MSVHEFFNLSYANYLVLPRLFLEAMPTEWQQEFVALIREIPEFLEIPEGYSDNYTIKLRCSKTGKFIEDPYANYRRGRINVRGCADESRKLEEGAIARG